MDVLRFKIYKVSVDSKNKSNEDIVDESVIKFDKEKEKAFFRNGPIFLLPKDSDLDAFLLQRQQEDCMQLARESLTNKLLN